MIVSFQGAESIRINMETYDRQTTNDVDLFVPFKRLGEYLDINSRSRTRCGIFNNSS